MAVSSVQLGGELAGRSILGGNTRNTVERWGMWISIVVLAGVQLLLMRHIWTILIVVPAIFASVWLWTPRADIGHCSPIGRRSLSLRYWWHRVRGRLDSGTTDDSGALLLPGAVGKSRSFPVEMWPGREDPGEILIQRHRLHGKTVYVAAFEFRTRRAGVQSQLDSLRPYQAWANFQAALARQGSFARYLQQVSRIVPYDPQDHIEFIVDKIPEKAAEIIRDLDNEPTHPVGVLAKSYSQLVDAIETGLEQNRTWLVVGIPATAAFTRAVSRVRLGENEDGTPIRDGQRAIESVIAGQLRMVDSRARAEKMELRPLHGARFAAVCRSLQDPDQPLDRLEGATEASMWLPWIGSDSAEYVRIKGARGSWFTRTAIVPRDGFAPGELPVDLLTPLLTGVSPSMTRTISTHVTLVPATQARGEARQDVATDASSVKGKPGTISDGTSEAQLGVSQRRLVDLRPGSGVHGAEWAMGITIQARTLDELEDATNAIEEAAADSHISRLMWQDRSQHLALPLTMPLGIGLARRKAA